MLVRFSNLVNEDGVWLISGINSFLIRLRPETEETIWEATFAKEGNSTTALQKLGDYIIAAPFTGDSFYSYHIPTRETRCIFREMNHKGEKKYFRSFKMHSCAYFIGARMQKIMKVSLNNGVPVCNEINLEVSYLLPEDLDMTYQAAITGTKAYIPINGTAGLIILDTKADSCEYIKVSENKTYSMASTDGTNVWLLTGNTDEVYLLDTKINTVSLKYKLPSELSGTNDRWFAGAVCHSGSMWIFPFYSNMLLKLDLVSGEATCIKKYDDSDTIKYLNADILDDRYVWGYNSIDNTFDIIDCNTGYLRSVKPKTPSNFLSYVGPVDDEGNGWVYNEEEVPIDILVNYMNTEGWLPSGNSNCEANIGKSIWDKLREEI